VRRILERLVLGTVMAVLAFILERRVVKALRKKR
jgi:hypothetical protein